MIERFLRVKGRVLAARARIVLDLDELQHLCRPSRTWVTREEWIRVWRRDRDWNEQWATAKRKLMLWRELLEEAAGVHLLIETLEDGEHRIYVDTPELQQLVEVHRRRASRVTEILAAAREGRPAPPDGWRQVTAAAESNPDHGPAIARDYEDRKFQITGLAAKYGHRKDRIKRILVAQRVALRKPGRMRITQAVSPDVERRALEAHDAGASSREVAQVLQSSQTTALKFLRAHGRDTNTKPPSERERPPQAADPPRGRARDRLLEGLDGRPSLVRLGA